MIHKRRTYSLTPVTSVEALAFTLHDHSWTLCSGFQLTLDGQDYLIVNDAFSADGAQEYAVLLVQQRDGDRYTVQEVESLTISWMRSQREVERHLRLALGLPDARGHEALPPIYYGGPFALIAQTTHTRCPLCA